MHYPKPSTSVSSTVSAGLELILKGRFIVLHKKEEKYIWLIV